jgi:ATP adenylyltransferase/5',5'''-P-1,P-4-tetraphosphate phosphorylase II
MASIKNLKKDINYVLGDVIDYALESSILKQDPKKGEEIIDEAIEAFDALIAKVNAKEVENKKTHYKAINAELELKSKALVDKINNI